jgi:hypothetical protein
MNCYSIIILFNSNLLYLGSSNKKDYSSIDHHMYQLKKKYLGFLYIFYGSIKLSKNKKVN